MSHGEPGLPPSFRWHDEELIVAHLIRSWRSTRTDRGDVYLAKHWFECTLEDGRRAVVYFERQAHRGKPRWWLYTLEDGEPQVTPAPSDPLG